MQKHSTKNQDKLPSVLSQTAICTVLVITQLLLMIPCGMVSTLSNLTKTVGTLRPDNRDRNENVKKAFRFYKQNNNSTHASRFLVISFP